ncbi:hypothetical protein N7456_012190 [Penicillium angulare]|uniref:Uncharacterized protein n=1 Tax=Penicillium angulare TaxID=116970 RepID=A0A9W9K0F4_9EURO|nr:hypothetical protein N7456_012190 [Penicillium angulare]
MPAKEMKHKWYDTRSASRNRKSAFTRESTSTRTTSESSVPFNRKTVGVSEPKKARVSDRQKRHPAKGADSSQRFKRSATPPPSSIEAADLTNKKRRRTRNKNELGRQDPRQSTQRIRVKIEDLDLDKSYVGCYPLNPQVSERAFRQPRWRHRREQPLIDEKKLPPKWSSDEPDLSESDIDGQIARCLERIDDNIMPHIFEQRLEEYKTTKAHREELAKVEPEGLSWDVVQRINTLKALRKGLRRSDPNKQLSNVKAILAAYRTKSLEWTGLVTYWSKGVQLSQPRPFDWDEHDVINMHHKADKSFWVEGVNDSFESPSPVIL